MNYLFDSYFFDAENNIIYIEDLYQAFIERMHDEAKKEGNQHLEDGVKDEDD